MLAVRALDSLSAFRYDSAMPVITFLPVGRFAVLPEDSARRSPPKTLYLDAAPTVNLDLYSPNQYGAVFADNIDVVKSRPTFTSLAADSAYADTVAGLLVVRTTADSVTPGADLRLVAIVTEDSVVTQGRFPVTWDHVARRIIPDYSGRSITPVRGDTLYDTFRFSTTGLNPAKLSAAVFIQNMRDNSIIQSLAVRSFNH